MVNRPGFCTNIGSFISFGSSISYYQMQIDLVKKIENHKFHTVRQWARNMSKSLENRILRERIDEESRDR